MAISSLLIIKSIKKYFLQQFEEKSVINRFLNAEAEYFEAGGVDAVTRALQIDEGEVNSLSHHPILPEWKSRLTRAR